MWESNPQERSSSDSFRDCSACPCPTFLELAGALGFEPRKVGLESASLAFSLRPQDAIREESNLHARFRAAALQAAAEPFRPLMREDFLEIWEREAAPAELTLILATILSRHAFGSEGVPLNESAAEAVG